MTPQMMLVLQSLPLLILIAQMSWQVCVELQPDTEAVEGTTMKLRCISCKKREELEAKTQVDWYYITAEQEKIHIFQYPGELQEVGERWKGRLIWNGTSDLQDVSIKITNVSLNDTGTYMCKVFRLFTFTFYTTSSKVEKHINLTVRKKASKDVTAIYSEIMMYVLLVFLSLWLLMGMAYCYWKISRAEARTQDKACSSKNSSLVGQE